MVFVPRTASQEQVLAIVREWVDVLAREDYAAVSAALGYGRAFGEPKADCIRNAIKNYRSPEYFPGVVDFRVTDWRTARGGNSDPASTITWYKPNDLRMAGAVAFDLPLNGCWSDLTADLVFFDRGDPEGYALGIEEIASSAQAQRELEERQP